MRRVLVTLTVTILGLNLVSVGLGQAAQEPPKADTGGKLELPRQPSGPRPAEETTQPRGYLGILVDDGPVAGRGVRVLRVNRGSPAEKAGLLADDLITALGGVRVRQLSEAAPIFQQVPPGAVLTIEFLRGDQRKTIDVTFGRRPEELPLPAPSLKPPGPPSKAPPAPAPAPPDDVRGLIEALLRRIEELERRVEALERPQGTKEKR